MLDPRREIVARDAIRVWDPFVRVFHWTLVIAFALAYVVIEPYIVHILAGAAIGILVAARIVWGFLDTGHARFADFVYSPVTVLRYVQDLLRFREHDHYVGHSPGGGYVILGMLTLLMATVVSGAIAGLAETQSSITQWHGILADITLGLICVHVAGVLLRSFVYRQNLIAAQFTGYKRH